MTTIVEQLTHTAEMEKKAYFEYVKSFSTAGISSLAKGGMAIDKASALVKEACLKDSRAVSMKNSSLMLEKTAEYVKTLEDELGELKKFAKEIKTEKQIEESTPMSKLASIGFTKEELAYINSLPENLVTKVASIGSQPWEMGGGVGIPREKTDPLLEFILS